MRNNFARQRLVLNQRKMALDEQMRQQFQLKLNSYNVRLNMRNMHQESSDSRQVEKGRGKIKVAVVQGKIGNPHQLIGDIIELNRKESILGQSANRTMQLPSKHQSVPQQQRNEREFKRFEWPGSSVKQAAVHKSSRKREEYVKQGGIIASSNLICIKPIKEVNNSTGKRLHSNDGSNMIEVQQQEEEDALNIEENQSSLDENQLLYRLTNDKFSTFSVPRRTGGGQAELKFREKLKIKLSRRHMYHTLKHKSEVLHKIKPHSYSFTKKQRINPEEVSSQIYRVHDRKSHSQGRAMPASKNMTMTMLQNLRQLRIDSKRMMFEVANDNKTLLNIKTCGNVGECKKTNIEIYEQIMASMPREVLKCHKTEESQYRRKTEEALQENVFRELTPWRPWHGEDGLY